MKQIRSFILVCFLFAESIWGANLPSYITKCSLSDESFSKCAISSANKAISRIVKGDKKYKIQNLDPIIIPEVKFEVNSNSRLILNNVTTSDLKNIKVTEFSLDPVKKTLEIQGVIDRLEMISNYDALGVLLSIPIKGNGKGNTTIVEGSYTYRANYTLKPKNNEEYLEITSRKFDFKSKRTYFYMDKLFGDNQQLNDEFNKNLNENWDVIAKDAFPFFGSVMESVTESVLNGIFKNVPFKDIFLP
ncbi:circadian clock-controlled protein daywake-like isoform X1 [Onthophagus taurus]|uniref:circadian clock-controlled protein daywake-like isoform X1 n=1 Tax=Onthophagus taurus TaxID=166361 RepID=UPI0039BE091B